MNLPGIVFQRFIKFARQAAIRPVHPHFLLESDVLLHTRIYLNFLPPRNSWARYYTRENTDTARYARRPVFYCHHRRINMRTFPPRPPTTTIKMIKKGIDCPTTLKCWNTYGNAPSPMSFAFRWNQCTPNTFFLTIVAIAFEDPAVPFDTCCSYRKLTSSSF